MQAWFFLFIIATTIFPFFVPCDFSVSSFSSCFVIVWSCFVTVIITQWICIHPPFLRCFRTTVLQSMKLGIDVNRHKEIIVKAISGLLLLLLKHFKLNHIYQVCCAFSFHFNTAHFLFHTQSVIAIWWYPVDLWILICVDGWEKEIYWFWMMTDYLSGIFVQQFEFTSQHLVFANCIPLVLKFFNQDIVAYVNAKNRYVYWSS